MHVRTWRFCDIMARFRMSSSCSADSSICRPSLVGGFSVGQ